jgi:hypothetical protein
MARGPQHDERAKWQSIYAVVRPLVGRAKSSRIGID